MNKTKIVLIEDDEILAKVLRQALIDGGFEVVLKGDGVSGLAVVKKEVPDLVLLDLLIPKKNGLTLLAELKASPVTREIPVSILTVLSAEDDIRKGIDLGAIDYIIKSQYSVSEIVAKVKKFFEKEGLLIRKHKTCL